MHWTVSSKKNVALAAAVSSVLALGSGGAWAIGQSGEAKNMIRLGHTDLQGRPSYQPNVIDYPDGRTILFVGMHSGVPRPVDACPQFLPNPLNGNACENNGTMIIDVTDPRNPVEETLIPAPPGGQAQMARMCLGSQLSGDVNNKKVYLLRNVQGGASSGYQVYDVTDVKKPVLKSSVTGIRSTHKPWWECNTGIAYLVGSRAAPAPLWRQAQSMVIFDWQNPEAAPTYLRTYGLPGGQPGTSGPTVPSLHGPISAHEHPHATSPLARPRKLAGGANNPDDVIGNRLYLAYGVGDDGVLQILDRKQLLPPLSGGRGGVYAGPAETPSDADLLSAQAGIMHMSPDQGGHTSMPVFGLKPPSYGKFNEFATRDIVLLASEATADGVNGRCNEAPHWSFVVDVTVENSKTSPPGTHAPDPSAPTGPVETNPWQGPMVLSTMSVDERSGAQYARGNYCGRGARFGVHSSEENFHNPLYGKLTAIAYFNGGVRIWDIREPQAPREVAFYVPEANANTDPDGYMTNNVEIDNRGYVYVVDRNGAGMDVLQLNGCAKQIVDKGHSCNDLGNNNAAGNGGGHDD
jgi:hypothetical protein